MIHECTFINGGDRRGQNHAVLSEILDNVREASDIKRLILYHISSRYSSKISVLRKKLQEEFAEKGIKIYLVHPKDFLFFEGGVYGVHWLDDIGCGITRC